MKSFRKAGGWVCRFAGAHKRFCAGTLTGAFLLGLSVFGWQARAALPRWMQDVIAGSGIEAALYRVMELPGAKVLYPRPPKEAQAELSPLIAKAPEQAELYSLRAMEEEQALDFKAAEADWKAYAARAKDPVEAKLELADYYHRRLQARDEVETLMQAGASPARSDEMYVAAPEQRSWKAFERLLAVAADQKLEDQRLDEDPVAKAYAAWMVRYPRESSLYAREFRWLLEGKRFDRAEALIGEYQRGFAQDAVFPLKARALLEYRRGSIAKALATYDSGFQPLWPAELVQSYYGLLAETHNQRRFVADAQARLARNPDDLNAMARLFYYAQQQGHLEAAQDVVEAYRQSKESRKAAWSAQELYTLAQLMEGIHAYAEAARYDFALYHAQGSLANGASAQVEGLSSMVHILLTAPEQPVEIGAGNLSMYRDIATLDRGPGYWNGILSLWLNTTSPEQSYHEEEERARPYFHRAKAAELLGLLDKKYPTSTARAGLHKELIGVYAEYGESALVVKAGNDFLNGFAADAREEDRVWVAMRMADAYASQQDMKGEFALYERMLTELSGKMGGMPLTAAAATSHAPVAAKEDAKDSAAPDASGEDEAGGAAADAAKKKAESKRAFDVSGGAPGGVFVAGALEYEQLLERYLGRLTATRQLPQALAVLRKELDRNPNDPLLYERLANFLQQNNLSAQQEEVYSQAIQKFQDKSWYDKLARLYLREKKREALAELTRQVTGIFHGTDLEEYFAQVRAGGPQLFLELNLYAHERFPHDRVFVENLLQAYQEKATRDPEAWEKLLREHWSDSEPLRMRFFDYLSRTGKLDAELAQLHTLVPDAREVKANPAATRELAEAELWRSHFEASAALLGSLAEAYPADVEVGTQASSVYRSLAYYDGRQTGRAIAVEEHLLAAEPADTERLARIGDIYADSGAEDSAGHEDIAAASPYWRRIPLIHPGSADGYLKSATVFWDYFQFDDALAEIRAARTKFDQPALFGYEAGAIDEGKRELAGAIHEYTLAATSEDGSAEAGNRLVQLARRKATAKMVDEETAHALEAHSGIAALQLRERVLKAQKREAEIAPLLEGALGKATTLEEAQLIGSEAQLHALTSVYERALEREIEVATDPVQKIELSYDLARSEEGRKDVDGAARVVGEVYRENPRLLGVVRATADFYWRNKQAAKAIATLMEAAEASKAAQPALSRQYTVEAASKANDSGSYAQARGLMAPLMDATGSPAGEGGAYNAQYLAVVADSYARAGDDAGLKQFYLDKLKSIHDAQAGMSAEDRRQKTVLLRRGLIPALARMKDYGGAVEQYIAILSAYPEDGNATQEAALFAIRYGRQGQLLEFLSATVKASPRDSRFAIMQAQVQTILGDYPAAIDAYARAIAIRADRADVYEAKADLEVHLQRLDDACKEYERLYVLSYQNPDWMVKLAEVRARQGRGEDAVKALERAWIEGHPASATNDFRVATQLETWNMLEDSLRFAEKGVQAEGDDLLGGSGAGNPNGDDAQGAVIYTRLMTRLRREDKALTVLDAARKAADLSPYSPSVVAEQVEKNGIASVTDSEWRKRRIEQRQQMATQRYNSALQEMGKTAGEYFTPEEKRQLAQLVDVRWKLAEPARAPDREQWIAMVSAAGIPELEAQMRKQVLLNRASEPDGMADAQLGPYEELERSRMEYVELAQTLEAYAPLVKPGNRRMIRIQEAQAYRDAGDEVSELRVMRRISFEGNSRGDLRERYLQLLLKHDVAAFEAYGDNSADEATALAAANYATAHSDLKVARAALGVHARAFDKPWESAYSALLGLYFRDASAETDGSFHRTLGDEAKIGERLRRSDAGQGQAEGQPAETDNSRPLAGGSWFYYGMRYGVYRTLSPKKGWAASDPEDFLAAGLERNPTSASNYITLARAYAEADETSAALAEYRHALELTPDSPAVYDAMAMLLWSTNRRDEAIADWRQALAALNRVQDKGPAPESFWSGFALIAQHVARRKLTVQLHEDLDGVARKYIGRNGNYRSNELLKAVYEASAESHEGVAWMLSLAEVATSPGAVLSDIDATPWLPRTAVEPILLRELELDRMGAGRAKDNQGDETDDSSESYLAERVARDERQLMLYYLEQKQDAEAEALIAQMTDVQRREVDVVQAQLVLAVRGKRLDALLARYRADWTEGTGSAAATVPGTQILRSFAGVLAADGDLRNALAVWEYVFERGQLQHELMTSDYLGLAEARIRMGDTAGGIDALRKMTLTPGDVYALSEMAAGLLEKSNHPAEAIEFLSVMVKGVPWNGTFAVRLAQARIRAGEDKPVGEMALRAVAAESRYGYELRVQAAAGVKGSNAPPGVGASLGSGELDLLALAKITPQQAEQPGFAAARIAAEDAVADGKQRAQLLREAVSLRPSGFAVPEGIRGTGSFTGNALRMGIFRAEAAVGRNAVALNAIEPLLNGSYAYANRAAAQNDSADESGDASTDAEGSQASAAEATDEALPALMEARDATLAELQSQAPLPPPEGDGERPDAEAIALCEQIAEVFEHTDNAPKALAYLKLAAYLQKDGKLHAELQGRVDRIRIAMELEARNALRMPKIQRALDQSSVVRPRFTAAELAREEAAQ